MKRVLVWAALCACDGAGGEMVTVPVDAGHEVKLQVAVTGSGTVVSDVPVIDCGYLCDATLSGGRVTLTAHPEPGWRVSEWKGVPCQPGPTCSFVMSKDMDVSVSFRTGPIAWAKSIATTQYGLTAVAIDGLGGVYAAVQNRDAQVGGPVPDPSAYGVLVVEYDQAGVYKRARGIGGADVWVTAMAGRPTGGVVVTGLYSGASEFGGSPSQTPFVAAYAEDGTVDWVLGRGVLSGITPSSAIVTDQGEVWIAGSASGTVQLGSTQYVTQSDDAFILHVNAAGMVVKGGLLGGPNSDGRAMVADAFDGTVSILQCFWGSVDVGRDGWGGEVVLSQTPDANCYLANLRPDLTVTSAKLVPGYPIALGPTVVGSFRGTIQSGGRSITSVAGSDGYSLGSTSGDLQQYGGFGQDEMSVTVPDAIGGTVEGDVFVGTRLHLGHGGEDVLLVTLYGTWLFGGPYDDRLLMAASRRIGYGQRTVIAGTYYDTMDFGGLTITPIGTSRQESFIALF